MTIRNLDRFVRKLRDEVAELDPAARNGFDQFFRYRDDPVGFVRDILGAASATLRSTGAPYQFSILTALASESRIAVRSGHGVGKSTLDAWAALWWLLTRPYSRVIIVAPEFSRQVRAVLFGEIRKWAQRSKVALPVQVLANRVTVTGFGDEWGAIGLPATEPHRIEGFHAEAGVLLILDETKGVPDAVYDALQGALTGQEDNRLLVTSTPGAPTGIFYRIFSEARDDWRLHHIPSPDSSLVSPAWVEQRRKEWGEASPLYVARVLGDFPQDEEGVLLPLRDLEAAVGRSLDQDQEGERDGENGDEAGRKDPPVTLGVDPARFGPDRTALAIWRGRRLERVISRQGMDLMKTAAWVASYIHRLNPARVRIDSVGLGAGLVDRLNQMGHDVEDVNVGRAASDPELYANLRAELFWRFREELEKRQLALPDDEQLLAELSAVRYDFAPAGQVRVEKKDQAKKRLGRSPDLADAAVLGFGPATAEPGRFAYIGGHIVDLARGEIVREMGPFMML
jgi:hypothetical protein